MLETQREHVPDNDAGELDTALAFLDFVRSCLLKKLDGLDEDAQRRRLVVSETTLLGLVRHSIDGERYWFSYVVGGDDQYAEVDFGMDVPETVTSADVVAAYRAAIADSNAAIREHGLDAQVARWDFEGPRSVRWVVAHMTGETARHAGHADILRELIDGVTGR
ncbi:MAG: DinB family protein [Marmoricola sp.]